MKKLSGISRLITNPMAVLGYDCLTVLLAPFVVIGLLSGCASELAKFNAVVGSPAATQAVANLQAGSKAILCTIAGLANETAAIATQVNAKQVIIKDSQTAYVISGSLCVALGGTVGASVTVPTH